ncbi:hypothetical protein CWI42_050280 [Ordospora colligata]|uniref:Uncharacterized protein n=1 Tax=Ordospora colligata OC4 TaxID=1354746 RepID=A0A0B2UKV4_9MICR|nr:uncharacterized protein M896_050310 [Ordospora colligata OC4]KHN69625.1 hypothetical protein M896_050310 [Ordospora colligata OC4]TBU15744.1 hypothetical protein CWI41_050300 [Ordospora colligata]TBU15872.1 hypothetical protein CWI40_050320 [Ordospora colligata]TBU18766.1 hypothetical protein CWI42_050280 [Ordospora colligata]
MDQGVMSKKGVKSLRRSTRNKTQMIIMDTPHDESINKVLDVPIMQVSEENKAEASVGITNGQDVPNKEKRMFSFNSLVQVFSGMERCIDSERAGSAKKHEEVKKMLGMLSDGCVKHLLRVFENSKCDDKVNDRKFL